MKVERAALAVVVVAGLGGCGALNGWTNGDIQSPFQDDTKTGEGEGEDPGEGEGENPGEGEGEDEPNQLTTTPQATPSLAYQPLTTVDGVSFTLALPTAFAETKYAVVVVSASPTCFPEALALTLFNAGMAIVQVSSGVSSGELTEVFDALEHDIQLDDSQTFAVTAGDANRLLPGTRVGNADAPGLVLLSPALLPPLNKDDYPEQTSVFGGPLEGPARAMAEDNGWAFTSVDGGDIGCGLLTAQSGATPVVDLVSTFLLRRDNN